MDHESGVVGTVADIVEIPERMRSGANIEGAAAYEDMYRRSLADPDGFWADQARRFLTWFRDFDSVRSGCFEEGDVAWFNGACPRFFRTRAPGSTCG